MKEIYIFIYELDSNYYEHTDNFEFISFDESSSLENEIEKFLKNNSYITKLIITNIKDTYKVPIEVFRSNDETNN